MDNDYTKRKSSEFNDEEKKYLLCSIKRRRVVWDRTCDEYSRRTLMDAWQEISKENHKSVEACRAAWRKYCDRKRYYDNKAKKTANICDSEDFFDGCTTDTFEIIEDISEQGDNSAEQDFILIKSEDSVESTQLSEAYISPGSPTLSHNNAFDIATQSTALDHINTLHVVPTASLTINPEIALTFAKTNADKAVQTTPTVVEETRKESEMFAQFKHHYLLAHLGSLLEQLPNKSVNYLGSQFIAMTYEQLRKHRLT